ncbi:MAG: gas vesicle protein GvpC [Bacteroidota bacterium]|nr:gas vesicle protein GvpC [Bacteroidota bacterium]
MKQKTNPLLMSQFDTPFESIPFDKINNDYYVPAIKEAIKIGKAEIDAIVSQNAPADFENTIVALDRSGAQLELISAIFFNLLSAESDDEMQGIAQEISPLLTEYSNDIMLNEALFARVKAVYDEKNDLDIKPDQTLLLDDTYRSFVRNGALLKGKDREIFREISTKLGTLNLQFDENALKEINKYQLHITDKVKLGGLPEFVLDAAAEEAAQRELDGWIFTLHYTSYGPFMQYAENRALRRKLYTARTTQCSKGDELDNTEYIKEIVKLRIELANLFGYDSYADYVLTERMAESAKNVNEFLSSLAEASMPKAKEEKAQLQKFAKADGADFDLMPWDWSYYSEMQKNALYKINDSMTKPYFKLENVEESVLGLATQLYDIQFNQRTDIPIYHKDVKTYEVTNQSSEFLGLLYLDFFPRASKQSGAWMTGFRSQYRDETGDHRPHITIVCNFSKPTENKPSLLSFDEVTTFLHEFGHGLHGMLSQVEYKAQSGTSVARDFVELPSQLMENFAYEKTWLKDVAIHYKTGESMPDSMINRIIESGKYHAGFASTRQLSLGMTDMAWHSLTEAFDGNVIQFEHEIMAKTAILPQIDGAATSPTFAHIFAGGYAAGYYGYKWAEVLDADAFASFKTEGIFNKATAARFRDEILARGGSRKEMDSYIAFKGREPKIDALLEREGLK